MIIILSKIKKPGISRLFLWLHAVDFGNDLIHIWKYPCFQFGIDPGISYGYLKSSAG
jgi:hypothetical protein